MHLSSQWTSGKLDPKEVSVEVFETIEDIQPPPPVLFLPTAHTGVDPVEGTWPSFEDSVGHLRDNAL